MEKKKMLSIGQSTKVLLPASSYNMQDDNRLLIPFTCGDKIGFANKKGEVVVKPQFTMYYDDCYNESDNIRVTVDELYGVTRSGGKVSAYKRPIYGLINSKGETIFEPAFYTFLPSIGEKKLYTVQNKDYKYAVLNIDGTEVVPFGKYSWIDGFDNGLARVKIGNLTNGQKENGNKWGLIEEIGIAVVALEYDNIWNFYGKQRVTTNVINGNVVKNVILSKILDMDTPQKNDSHSNNHDANADDNGTNYGEYAGSYAQDVERYSDDVIDDAFDGDPDAYWNID